MWRYLKSAVAVVVVTLIIWFFAEAESLRSTEVRGVEITFQALDGARYVVDLSQETPGVRANTVRTDLIVTGPAAALEPVERTLRRPIIVSPGMDGLSATPGRQTVDLQELLTQHPDLRGRGVSYRSVSPPHRRGHGGRARHPPGQGRGRCPGGRA